MTTPTSFRPVPKWIDQYNAGEMTLADLAELIANHEFEPDPNADLTYEERIVQEVGQTPEDGTYDDVTFGDLTESERQVISERVWRDVER